MQGYKPRERREGSTIAWSAMPKRNADNCELTRLREDAGGFRRVSHRVTRRNVNRLESGTPIEPRRTSTNQSLARTFSSQNHPPQPFCEMRDLPGTVAKLSQGRSRPIAAPASTNVRFQFRDADFAARLFAGFRAYRCTKMASSSSSAAPPVARMARQQAARETHAEEYDATCYTARGWCAQRKGDASCRRKRSKCTNHRRDAVPSRADPTSNVSCAIRALK